MVKKVCKTLAQYFFCLYLCTRNQKKTMVAMVLKGFLTTK